MPTPTYAEVRQARADRPAGNYLKASDFPNGIEVTVQSVEVGTGFDKVSPVPVWNVTSKDFDGVKKLNESGFMSGRLEALDIIDPTGRSFVLAQQNYKGQVTWSIARAL